MNTATKDYDSTPLPHSLLAQARSNLTWVEACSEVIDNAFDAKAQSVQLEWSKKGSFACSDDGHGASDFMPFFRIGESVGQSKRIGRYGVGLKDAALWAGDLSGALVVESVNQGRYISATYDWEAVNRTNRWPSEKSDYDPVECSIKAREATIKQGTRILFTKSKKVRDMGVLRDDLAWRFSPGIREGKQVLLIYNGKRIPVPVYEMPVFDEEIRDEIEVGGRRVKLRVGMLKDGTENRHPGIYLGVLHRIICPFPDALNGLTVRGITGIIELGHDWTLTRNKTQLSDTMKENVANAVHIRCRGLFERAHRRAITVQTAALDQTISGALNAVFKTKEKRNSTPDNPKIGIVIPVCTGKKKGFRKVQPGRRSIPPKGFTITWERMGTHEPLGRVQRGRYATITLNESDPTLLEHRNDGNAELLAVIAGTLYVQHRSTFDADGHQLVSMPEDWTKTRELMQALIVAAHQETNRQSKKAV